MQTPGARILLTSFAVVLGLLSAADAQDRGGRDGPDRRGARDDEKKGEKAAGDLKKIVKLGKPVRENEGFFDLTYTERDEKGKRKSKKAFVKIDDKTPLFLDRRVKIEQLDVDKKVWILGRVVEREVRDGPGGPGGAGGGVGGLGGNGGRSRGTDRQIQNARVVLCGEELSVNRSVKDPKDKAVKWLEATVTSSTSGLWVRYEGNDYRVTMARKGSIVRRYKTTEKERKLLSRAKYIHLVADESKDRPLTSKKADQSKASFASKRVIILDPRLVSTTYPLLFR